jgi:hypothetical protein
MKKLLFSAVILLGTATLTSSYAQSANAVKVTVGEKGTTGSGDLVGEKGTTGSGDLVGEKGTTGSGDLN